jgi:hypothetical protein
MIAHMTTAAARYPGCTDRLRKDGFPAIARMAEILPSPKAIDDALGTNSAASHWLAGRNKVSNMVERSAAHWLLANSRQVPPAEPAKDDSAVLMVICPRAKAEKATRVLGLLGCEVEEI